MSTQRFTPEFKEGAVKQVSEVVALLPRFQPGSGFPVAACTNG